MFYALQPEGCGFESTSNHCVATMDKLLTHSCMWGRQWETTSLISSSGGVKAFRQITIIIITTFYSILVGNKRLFNLILTDCVTLIEWPTEWLINNNNSNRFQNDRSSMPFPRFQQARRLALTVSPHNTSKTWFLLEPIVASSVNWVNWLIWCWKGAYRSRWMKSSTAPIS